MCEDFVIVKLLRKAIVKEDRTELKIFASTKYKSGHFEGSIFGLWLRYTISFWSSQPLLKTSFFLLDRILQVYFIIPFEVLLVSLLCIN